MIKLWREKLELLLLKKDYKDIMLLSLLYFGMSYFALLSIVTLVLGYYYFFAVKFIALIALYSILKYYQKSSKLKLSSLFLMIVIEIDIASVVAGGAFFELPALFPFLIIAGFFFFFNIKEAIIATILYYIFWIIIFLYAINYVYVDSLVFTYSATFNIFATSVFILIFSISYYFSTRVIFEKTQKALLFKENILKEIYHRINNNLNFMASILGLQINHAKKNPPKSYADILKTSRLRIESIAMTHEVLYETHNFKEIEFKRYIQKLTSLIGKTYGKSIDITIQSGTLKLDNVMINKLGIIINELLTNTIKHSLNEKIPQVKISLKKDDSKYYFSYHEEDGQKIEIQKFENSKTLGMRLIRLTVEDMQGEMKIFWDGGLWVEIVIPF